MTLPAGFLLALLTIAACPQAAAAPVDLDPSIPGIGATRDYWDVTHHLNPNFDSGEVYGDDPTLPTYLSNNGAVYFGVIGADRVEMYSLNMQTLDQADALMRVKRELPFDASTAWQLKLDQCYRVAYNSDTLAQATGSMAVVELQNIQDNGAAEQSPDMFNQASFSLSPVGSQPNPDFGC